VSAAAKAPRSDAPRSELDPAPGTDADREARAVLATATDAGDPGVSDLVRRTGAVAALAALRAGAVDGSAAARYRRRLALIEPGAVAAATAGSGARVVVPGDPEWPTGLDDLDVVRSAQGWGGAPVALWVRGPARLGPVTTHSVAVVGSREATAYGCSVAAELAEGLTEQGWSVVSGGAYGIDGAAHRGALSVDGGTVAVLAGGVDVPYPRGNAALLERIAEEGLLVSEAPPGAAPTRRAFLIRNRLIAAMTSGTVVVEAALRSGALNTATWANGCLRVVMAVPGPVTSPLSAGTHRLLRDAEAVLVTGAADVVATLAPLLPAALEQVQPVLTGLDVATGSLGPDSGGPGSGGPGSGGAACASGLGPGLGLGPDPRADLDESALLALDALAPVRPTGLGAVLAVTGLSPGAALAALSRLCACDAAESTDGGWRLSRALRTRIRHDSVGRPA